MQICASVQVLVLACRGRLLHPYVNVQAMRVTSSLLALVCQVTCDWYCKQITKLEASLEKDLETEDYFKVTKLSHNSAEKIFVKSKQNHQSKLEALLKRKQKQPELRQMGVTDG